MILNIPEKKHTSPFVIMRIYGTEGHDSGTKCNILDISPEAEILYNISYKTKN